MQVLIADDDKEFLELERRFLSQCGHDVLIASDGLECASVLRDFSPDVVVLDCGILWGGSDGVVALMLEDSRLSQTPVILVADVDPRARYKDIVEWMLIGWLPKPFGMNELLAQITNQLSSCELPNRRRAVPKLEIFAGVEQ